MEIKTRNHKGQSAKNGDEINRAILKLIENV